MSSPYSLRSFISWVVLPTALIVAPIGWVAHQMHVENAQLERQCKDNGLTPITGRRGHIVCVETVRDVHPN